MDLNQLLYRHQVALMCAAAATCSEARHAHKGMASLYAGRIDGLRPDAASLLLPIRAAAKKVAALV